MTYLMITNGQGTLEGFQRITDVVDPHAAGLLARYAGVNEHGLAIAALWESKAACDRFTAEHLVPALDSVLGFRPSPGGPFASIAFEAVLELRPAGRADRP